MVRLTGGSEGRLASFDGETSAVVFDKVKIVPICDDLKTIHAEILEVLSEMGAVPELARASWHFENARQRVSFLAAWFAALLRGTEHYKAALPEFEGAVAALKAIDVADAQRRSDARRKSWEAQYDARKDQEKAQKVIAEAKVACEVLAEHRADYEACVKSSREGLERRAAEIDKIVLARSAVAVRDARKKAGRGERKAVARLRKEVAALKAEREELRSRTANLRDMEELQAAHVARKARKLDELEAETVRMQALADRLAAESAELAVQAAGWM